MEQPSAVVESGSKKPLVIVIISVVVLAVLCTCSLSAYALLRIATGSIGYGDDTQEEQILQNFEGDTDLVGSYPASEISSSGFTTGQEIKVYGQVSSIYAGIPYFYLIDGDSSGIVYYQQMVLQGEALRDVDITNIQDGDYVIVNGKYDEQTSAVYALGISKVSEADVQSYNKARQPQLEIEVLDYPTTVSHACRYFEIPLRLTNVGGSVITHEQVYDLDSGANFFFYLDGNPDRTYWTNEDGSVGMMGLKEFEPLEPGDSVDVTFGGGGMVTRTVDPSMKDPDGSPHSVGIAGEYNILSSGFKGDDGQSGARTRELKFVWGTFDYGNFGYLTPDIQFETPALSITLQSDECDMNDIQRTVDMGYWENN